MDQGRATMSSTPSLPDFRAPQFLRDHMRSLLDFYFPICINRDDGGYYNFYLDDGTLTDRKTQHIVSTTRFIFNFATAAELFGVDDYREAAAHGVRYLDEVHRDPTFGGYFWVMSGRTPAEPVKMAYGHAFVLLAYASAAKAGIDGAAARIAETFDLLERRFWSPEAGLYVDEISRDWREVSPYRGQNANMHMTEAMLAAYEATGEARYLDRLATDAKAAIDAGVPLSEAIETIGTAEAGNWQLFGSFNARNATVAYTELEWE